MGEWIWCNLLKFDSVVDFVYFIILWLFEKYDGVLVDELFLIVFLIWELFFEKLFDFDLIIFDCYCCCGFLLNIYLENVCDYVLNGGVVFVLLGLEFVLVDSIYCLLLGEVILVVLIVEVCE